MEVIARPTKEQVRDWLAKQRQNRRALGSIDQVRSEVGWQLRFSDFEEAQNEARNIEAPYSFCAAEAAGRAWWTIFVEVFRRISLTSHLPAHQVRDFPIAHGVHVVRCQVDDS